MRGPLRGIHLTGVAWGDGSPSCRRALPEVRGRVPGLVPDRCGLPGLPGVAALACWLRLPRLRPRRGLAAGRWPVRVQRALEIGSYQTAWTMLHRLRSVLVRPGRDRLTGTVEVDETYIGGEEPGLRGGRARGKKVLTGIAVEVREPKGLGRCRMAPLTDASAASLHAFVADHVEPGARVITDAWQGYRGLDKLGYVHDRHSQRAARARGEDPGALLPGVHRVASLAKRWLLGTHQGSVEVAHLVSYMNRVRVPLQPSPLPQPGTGVLPGAP